MPDDPVDVGLPLTGKCRVSRNGGVVEDTITFRNASQPAKPDSDGNVGLHRTMSGGVWVIMPVTTLHRELNLDRDSRRVPVRFDVLDGTRATSAAALEHST